MELISFAKKKVINDAGNFSYNYKNEDAIIRLLTYISQPEDKETLIHMGALGLPLASPAEMAEIMIGVQRIYAKDSGRRIRHECLHIPISEATDQKGSLRIWEISFQFALFYYYNGFQVVFAIHAAGQDYHIHYAINTVSFCDGHKYRTNCDLFEYQRNYAASLIGTITQKLVPKTIITWEEFEFSDSLYIPPELFQA